MTPEEERKRIAAERKAAYRKRKRAEELAHQAPKEEQERLFNEQARNIAPELEEAFCNAKGTSTIRPFPPGVLYQDNHKDELADMLAASEERRRRVELIMSMYQRDAERTNALLWHLIENIILMRLELTDMIGSLRK